MPTPRSRFAVIFLTVLIDLIGFGIILPTLPYYAQRFGAAGLGFGWLVGAFSLMQFLATALLGRLSDRVGRRPVLLATMLINAAGYALFAFAGSYLALFISRVVSGFASGNISAAQAYMADITTPAERSRGMGLIGAAFGIGFVIGPLIGGAAGHYGGHAAPGLVAAALSFLNFVSAYRILPESLTPERRGQGGSMGFGHLGIALARPAIRPLVAVWFLTAFAFAGYTVALPLFAGTAFGWKERELSLLFALIGVVAATVQGYLFGRIARRTSDRALVILGMLGMAIGIAVVPFVGTSLQLYAWTIPLAFANSVMVPAANGLVSKLAGADEQGTMLGAAHAFAALGRFAGPEALGFLYDKAGATTAFLTGAAIMVVGGLIALQIARPSAEHATMPAGAPAA